MKMDLRIQAKMSHQLVMTPQLQQAIKLLQLSHQELEKLIDQSIIENPTLEIADSTSSEDYDTEKSSKEEIELDSNENNASQDDWIQDEQADNSINNDDEWQDYIQQGAGLIKETSRNNEDGPDDYMFVEKKSLKSHLEWQIDVSSFSEEEKTVAFILVGYLNENGYLTSSVNQILSESAVIKEALPKTNWIKKARLQESRIDKKYFYLKYQETSQPKDKEELPAKLLFQQATAQKNSTLNSKNEVAEHSIPSQMDYDLHLGLECFIRKMQTLEPTGVFARSLQECLSIQARQDMADDLVVNSILDKYFDKLVRQEFTKIAKALKINLSEVIAAKDKIIGLEPKPGRKYSDEPISYVVPDVFIFKQNNQYVVRMNNNIPQLSINNYYKNMSDKMSKSYSRQKNKSDDMNVLTSQYLVEKIRAAEWLIKSIDQRQKTILKVSESIVKRQQEFFEKGVSSLKPMVLKDVAEDIGVHESTVSRITTNKYMHSPQGIFELKYFFTSGIMQENGYFISSEKIKDLINKMISNEVPSKALTDSDLASKLEKEMNIKVARRTVAKYREAMRIEPSNRRKRKL